MWYPTQAPNVDLCRGDAGSRSGMRRTYNKIDPVLWESLCNTDMAISVHHWYRDGKSADLVENGSMSEHELGIRGELARNFTVPGANADVTLPERDVCI
jgi:hypothetical protein